MNLIKPRIQSLSEIMSKYDHYIFDMDGVLVKSDYNSLSSGKVKMQSNPEFNQSRNYKAVAKMFIFSPIIQLGVEKLMQTNWQNMELPLMYHMFTLRHIFLPITPNLHFTPRRSS
jgi:hypothetical protein